MAKRPAWPRIPKDTSSFTPAPAFLTRPSGVRGHLPTAARGYSSSIPAGKFVREIGQGIYGFLFAQVVRIDPQDNIWVVDRGSSLVIKFDPDGRVAMVMGRKPEAINVGAEWRGRRPRWPWWSTAARLPGSGHSGRSFQSARQMWPGMLPATFSSPTVTAIPNREVR